MIDTLLTIFVAIFVVPVMLIASLLPIAILFGSLREWIEESWEDI